ncbi:Holliday junction resolvase RuvX [Candidatus Peregrinibacteria bacterium]|nr:Holliday junction resolvase RuvX [Candidatus Peregrinibacteria bacterium]
MADYLSLDFGTKKIGYATGSVGMAFPRGVFQNEGIDESVLRVSALVEEFGIKTIIVGLPLNIDEDMPENRQNVLLQEFVEAIKSKIPDVKIIYFDERLSTFEAGQLLRDARSKGFSDAISKDALAAYVILQRFFDKRSP